MNPITVDDILTWLLRLEDSELRGSIIDLGDGAGYTRFGITQKWDSALVPPDFFVPDKLTSATAQVYAKNFYRAKYWSPLNLTLDHPEYSASVLSCAVNLGCHRALELSALAKGDLQMFITHWAAFYRGIVAKRPSDTKFLKGWEARATAIFPKLP